MTTQVHIVNFGFEPIEVGIEQKNDGEYDGEVSVKHKLLAHQSMDFYVHQFQRLVITESPHATLSEKAPTD